MDLFIAGGSPLDEQQLGRRRRVQVSDNPVRYLHVHTPEDILLQKLRWFQGNALDHDYLRGGADTLGVADLLARALQTVKARD